MQISEKNTVTIHYTLTLPNGEVVESSRDGDPLTYVHGTDALVPGLEKALEEKSAGDRVVISVSPEDGYGELRDDLIQTIPRSIFQFEGEIETGMRFQADTGNGIELVTVIGVDDENITVDGNHPMAGKTLNFDVDIIEVGKPPKS